MPLYTENDIKNALKEVQMGVSQRIVSKKYGIPRATLYDRINGSESATKAQEHLQRLSAVEEGLLSDWIVNQSALGLSPTHQQLRELAVRVLAARGDLQPLGKRWMEGFLRRNPRVKTLRGKGLDSARLNGATTEVITAFFQLMDIPLIRAIRQENRWNTDEHGLLEGKGSNGLVLGHSAKKIAIRKQLGSRFWTTIIECISATGKALPPLVIFKGDSVQAQWFEDEEELTDWRFTTSQNGWTSNSLALEWLIEVFIPLTRPQRPQEYRLLVVDGHGSHTTDDFMYECFKNKIYLLFLPAHTSHVLQPLDLSVFGPLKSYYRAEITAISYLSETTPIGKVAFIKAYKKARAKGITIKNLAAGWKASGLWPINPAKPLMSRLLVKPLNSPPKVITTPEFKENTFQRRSRDLLKTPRHSSHISKIGNTVFCKSTSRSTARLLFRKIGRVIDSQNTAITTQKETIRLLEEKIEQLKPKRRSKVIPDPNSRFVRIQQIVATKRRIAKLCDPVLHSKINSTAGFDALCFEWHLSSEIP